MVCLYTVSYTHLDVYKRQAYYLAKRLIELGISVQIVENKKERCEELSVLLPQAIIVNGDGTSEELLNEIGITTTESLVPLTGIDEENIMLTLYAKEVSNAKVVTKINRITYTGVIDQLDLGSVVSVSYTPLDVSKRQARDNLEEGGDDDKSSCPL